MYVSYYLYEMWLAGISLPLIRSSWFTYHKHKNFIWLSISTQKINFTLLRFLHLYCLSSQINRENNVFKESEQAKIMIKGSSLYKIVIYTFKLFWSQLIVISLNILILSIFIMKFLNICWIHIQNRDTHPIHVHFICIFKCFNIIA